MKKIIAKTFGLRDGEIHISFLMQLYIFIIITVLLIVKPTVNALFVSTLGADDLPYGYLLVAFIAVITSYLYSKAIRKFSFIKVTVSSLVFFCVSFIALSIILYFKLINGFTLYFYYIFVSLFAVVATSQFWIFANMVFNAREAKRIFGFIGAGAIAGGIFGGYLTSLISSNFGNEFAIFTAALLILFCIPIIRKVFQLRIKYLNIFQRKQIIANQDKLETSSLKLILKSKHLTYIAFITGIGVVVAKLVDFQFSDFANKSITDSDELAAFFGFWFSTFNVIALTVQLFFTNKILNRLGVSSTLLILPLAIGLAGLLFLTFPELWVLIIIKGIDGSFKQSLNKAAVELSVMPIPVHEKNQAKSYIDVAVDSIATGFAGFLLIFLIKNLDLSTSYITVIVLLFVFIWILMIYRLREAYFNSFKRNIEKTLTLSAENKTQNKKDNSLFNIKNIFKEGSESEILSIFDRIKNYKFKSLQKPVILLLSHPSNKVKIAALEYLDYFDDNNILPIVEAFVNEKDDTLVYVSLDYILEHSNLKETAFFNKYLDHKSSYVANGALLSLAKLSENNVALAKKYGLKERLEKRIEIFENSTKETRKEIVAGLLLSIAYSKMKSHYYFINNSLVDQKNYIVKFAIIAAGISSDELFLDNLISLLQNKKHRKSAIRALKSYGPRIINYILELDAKDELNSSIKRFVPKIIGTFKDQNAQNVLIDILKGKNSTSRLEASLALKKVLLSNENLFSRKRLLKSFIVKESAYYKSILQILISLQNLVNQDLLNESKVSNQKIYEGRVKLINALDEELDKSFSILFNLLSLVYNYNDIKIIQNAINSAIKEAKINSLELLENLLESNLKAVVLPIAEHKVLEPDNYKSSILKLELLNDLECLTQLMNVSGSNLRFLAVDFINQSNNKDYLPALLPLKKYRNPTVKKLAYDTYLRFTSKKR